MSEELYEIPTDDIILSEQVAVLIKDDKCAAIGLAIREGGTVLSSFDANGVRSSPMYSPLTGIAKFQGSVATSLTNGWRLKYLGVPRFG